jgi:hypothetical protein
MTTKLEQAVIEAAREWEKRPTIANADNLTQAVRQLPRVMGVCDLVVKPHERYAQCSDWRPL